MSDADEQNDFLGFEDPAVPVMSDESESNRDSVDEEREMMKRRVGMETEGRIGTAVGRRSRRRGVRAHLATRSGSPPSYTLTAEEVECGSNPPTTHTFTATPGMTVPPPSHPTRIFPTLRSVRVVMQETNGYVEHQRVDRSS